MISFGYVIWVRSNVGFAGDMLYILESPNYCRWLVFLDMFDVIKYFLIMVIDDMGMMHF